MVSGKLADVISLGSPWMGGRLMAWPWRNVTGVTSLWWPRWERRNSQFSTLWVHWHTQVHTDMVYIYVGWNSMVQWSPYYWMDGDTWRGLQLPSSSWSRRTPPFFLWGGAAYSWDEAWHRKNKMQPTNPKQIIWTVLYIFPLLLYKCIVNCGMWKKVECKARSVKKVECWVGNVVCRVCSGDCGV